MAVAAAILVAVAGGLYATGNAYRVTPASPASASTAPAPASLVRLLRTFPRPAPDGVPAGRVKAPPSKGASRLCVVLVPRCKAGKGYIIKLTPSRPAVRVTIKRVGCVTSR